mmetsp:Transcript_7935/g.20338  ORF Transcript_7935/g.20338 Transcript_7935/m.20338 type:complete len:147 (-) Transcript_7935:137-577(-)
MLKNLREYPVTSGSLSKEIEHMFKYMRQGDYAAHELKDYFEPRPGGGYKPKTIAIEGERGRVKMYDIDHVVPSCWGGLDHPRNYVIMHRSMNRSLRECMPEDKMAYLKKRDKGILRKVAGFVHDVLKSPAVQKAVKLYVETEMKDW